MYRDLLLDRLGVKLLCPAPLHLELLHMLSTFHWNALGSTLMLRFCRLSRRLREMVHRFYSGTMIVMVYWYTGIQVYRVYRESTGSTVRYTGPQAYRESTDSIQAQFWRGQ